MQSYSLLHGASATLFRRGERPSAMRRLPCDMRSDGNHPSLHRASVKHTDDRLMTCTRSGTLPTSDKLRIVAAACQSRLHSLPKLMEVDNPLFEEDCLSGAMPSSSMIVTGRVYWSSL